MNTATKFCAVITLAFSLIVTAAKAQTPSSSDLWDISQGDTVTFNSPLYSGSDIRDMFGGEFSGNNTGYTVFQDQPVGTLNAVEWQTPYYAQITNFNLFLSPDPAGARDIGLFNLYAWNGFSFQIVYSTNNIPTYSSPIIITGQPLAMSANRWRAEFTTAGWVPTTDRELLSWMAMEPSFRRSMCPATARTARSTSPPTP